MWMTPFCQQILLISSCVNVLLSRLCPFKVRVLVTDLDDNKPAFAKDVITTGVRVDAALQTEVVKLEAEDKDPTALPIRFVQNGAVSLNGCAFYRSTRAL